MESFRLQKLRPDTLYSVQVRCRNAHDGLHWSHWSTGSAKTPEDSEWDSEPGGSARH